MKFREGPSIIAPKPSKAEYLSFHLALPSIGQINSTIGYTTGSLIMSARCSRQHPEARLTDHCYSSLLSKSQSVSISRFILQRPTFIMLKIDSEHLEIRLLCQTFFLSLSISTSHKLVQNSIAKIATSSQSEFIKFMVI